MSIDLERVVYTDWISLTFNMFNQIKNKIGEGKSKNNPSVEPLAVFQGDNLVLNDQVLGALKQNARDGNHDSSTAIVCVVGPPSSAKTFMINSLFHLMSKGPSDISSPSFKAFPSTYDENGSLRDEDAILVAIPPIMAKSASSKGTIILLDILSCNPSAERYAKMVNFCMAVSSVTIISDFSTRDSETEIWSPSFAHLIKLSKVYFRRLIIFFDENQRTERHSEQTELKYKNISAQFEKIDRVFGNDLKKLYTDAAKGQNNCLSFMKEKCVSVNSRNFLDLYKHFQSAVNLLSQSHEGKLPTELAIKVEDSNCASHGQNKDTADKILDNKTSSAVNLEDHTKDLTPGSSDSTPMPLEELYWENMLQIYQTTSCLYLSRDKLRRSHKMIMEHLSPNEIEQNYVSAIYSRLVDFHQTVAAAVQSYQLSCESKRKETTMAMTSGLIRRILRYHSEDALDGDMEFNVFKRDLFDIASLLSPDSSVPSDQIFTNYPSNWKKEICETFINHIQELQMEVHTAKEVSEFIISNLNIFSRDVLRLKSLPVSTKYLRQTFIQLTDWTFKDLQGLIGHSQMPFAWDQAKLNLSKELIHKLKEILTENQIKITELDRLYSKCVEKCSLWYHEAMRGNKGCGSVDQVHDLSIAKVKTLFCELCQDVDDGSVKYWWTCLCTLMDNWKVKFAREFQGDSMERVVTTSGGAGNSDAREEYQSSGVGIYVAEDVIQMAVKSHSGIVLVQQDPYIAFRDGSLLIGYAARPLTPADTSSYNIYEFITRQASSDKISRKVKINDKVFLATPDLAVVMYFDELRKSMMAKAAVSCDSCVCLISNLLPPSGRQCLKEVLRIVGFRKSTLLPIAMAAALKWKESRKEITKAMTVLCLHQNCRLFEVSKVKVSAESIEVKRSDGYFNLKKVAESTFNGMMKLTVQKVLKTIKSNRRPGKDFDGTVFWQGRTVLQAAVTAIKHEVQPTVTYEDDGTLMVTTAAEIASSDDKNAPGMGNRFFGLNYHVPGAISVQNVVIKFPKENAISRVPGYHGEIKSISITEGFTHKDNFVPTVRYNIEIVPPCNSTDIQLLTTPEGCFRVCVKDDRSKISCKAFKFLTNADLKSLEVTLENFKQDEVISSAILEAKVQLIQVLKSVRDKIEKLSDSPELLNVIEEKMEEFECLLHRYDVSVQDIQLAICQGQELSSFVSDQ